MPSSSSSSATSTSTSRWAVVRASSISRRRPLRCFQCSPSRGWWKTETVVGDADPLAHHRGEKTIASEKRLSREGIRARSKREDGARDVSNQEEEEEEEEDTPSETNFGAAASLRFGINEKDDKKRMVEPGLYIVSTPIGNLDDITVRALKILTEATLILCEDTRKTRQLLTLLGIPSKGGRKPRQLLAYHSHNFYEQREALRDRIVRNEEEEVIALVSDAGAPVVSDPGQDLVDLVLEATSQASGGVGAGSGTARKNVVVPIPGASAVTTAVIGSGFKCDDGYKFCGFLPAKKNERMRVLESLASETSLLVFFVSPHKLVKTLEDVAAVFSTPPRRVCIARELTKRHEEFFRGTCEECLEEFSKEGRARGEITLLVECGDRPKTTKNNAKDTNDNRDSTNEETDGIDVEKTLRYLLLERAENPLSVSEAARKVSKELGVKRRVAYSLAQKIKDSGGGNPRR